MDAQSNSGTLGRRDMRHDSIAGLFLERVQSSPAQEALWIRAGSAEDKFAAITWEQLLHEVGELVQGLQQRGIQPGERVALLSENRREWIVVDLALQFVGAWHVPLSTHASDEQLQEILEHCQPSLVIVESTRQFAELHQLGIDQSQLIAFDEHEMFGEGYSLADLSTSVPPQDTEQVLAILRECQEVINPDDVCTLVYTSGTTGQPKGVMLSHKNLASNALALVQAYAEKPADRRLNFLPFSHLYARTCDLYTWIARGSQLVLAHSRETILADCQATGPTLINGVPYFFQKVLEGLRQRGKLHQVGALQEALGGKIRMASSGGAPLPTWVIETFQEHDLLLCEGYGLTETSPVITVSTPEARRPGSDGKPLAGVELRISDQGEIETRGSHVMAGYYRDPAATEMVLHDGWLKTGDLGHIDSDGYLWITGRRKEILVLSTGRKVSPSQLELAITGDPLVAQVIICGEGRKCLAALIVPEPGELRRRILEAGLWIFSKRQAVNHPLVRRWYREMLDERLSARAEFEQVAHFTILTRGFTPQSGEMTSKLSLRRDRIIENHQNEIEQMYSDQPTGAPWWRRWWS